MATASCPRGRFGTVAHRSGIPESIRWRCGGERDWILRFDVVGGGRCQAVLEEQARRLGLSDRVFFAGNVPGTEAVRGYLDRADLFVLPSRHEGLPGAMIEPCIGSDVGAFPNCWRRRIWFRATTRRRWRRS